MSLESAELWAAMKESRFRYVGSELKKLFENTDDLDTAIEKALGVIVNAVHAEAGTFWFFDRFGDRTIYPRKSFGGANISGIRLKEGDGVVGTVIETGESTIVYDCQSDKRWQSKVDVETGFRTDSMICIPLSIQENPFGCIQIINKTDDELFDDKDLAFAERLAEMVSEQFEGMHLLPEYEEQEDEEEESPYQSLLTALQEESQKKMEAVLNDAAWFNSQPPRKQWQIMSHMNELWKLMNKLQ